MSASRTWKPFAKALQALALAAAVCLSTAAFAPPLYSWDAPEHKLIAKTAVSYLPAGLKTFYSKHGRSMQKQVIQPDIDRQKDWSEKPRHFMNLDSYESFPFTEIPLTLDAALEKYSKSALFYYGVLPYSATDFSRRLVSAFKEGDREKIIRLSAYLSHYAADACMPLHSTKDYDGYAGGTGGLHAAYEMVTVRMALKNGLKTKEYSPALIPADKISGAVLEVLKEGYEKSRVLLGADEKALKKGSRKSRAYIRALTDETKELTVTAVERSAALTADLIYSAWVEAGSLEIK